MDNPLLPNAHAAYMEELDDMIKRLSLMQVYATHVLPDGHANRLRKAENWLTREKSCASGSSS